VNERSPVNGILRSMPWPAAEAVTALLTGAISLFVIARLIGADEFGRAAIALGIVLILQVGVNSLVHDALVRMPDMQPEDFETGFTATFAVAVLFTAIAMISAPAIGRIYDDQRLALLIVGFVPILILAAISETLIATYRRGLEFRAVAQKQIAGRFIGGVLGVTAALLQAGAWSLVVQNVVIASYITGAMLIHAGALPRFRISWQRLRPMLSFCAPIIASQVMTQATSRLLLMGMGRWHGLTVAGFWSAATRLSENLFGGLMQAAYNVSLAHFALRQNARGALLANLYDAQAVTSILSIPVLTGLAVTSRPLTLLLLGGNWLPVATLMLGPLVVCMLQIRRMFPNAALRAVGRSGISLVVSIVEFATLAIAFLAVGRVSATTFTFVYPLGVLAGSLPIFALVVRELGASASGQVLLFIKDAAVALIAFLVGRVVMGSVGDGMLIQLFAGGTSAFVTAATLLFAADVKTFLRLAGLGGGELTRGVKPK
jgi:teichuronic acid exporter